MRIEDYGKAISTEVEWDDIPVDLSKPAPKGDNIERGSVLRALKEFPSTLKYCGLKYAIWRFFDMVRK